MKKDYVSTEEGQIFLGKPENPVVGKVYEVSGGKRVIYEPNETHPWNHFSKESTGDAIDFYDMAFADYSNLVTTGKEGQTWMFKEWFSFVALIGFFMLFIPVISLLSTLPFFKNIYSKKTEALPEPKTNGAKVASYLLLMIFVGLYPALFFSALYGADFYGMRLLRQVSIILAIACSYCSHLFPLLKSQIKNIKFGSVHYVHFRCSPIFLFKRARNIHCDYRDLWSTYSKSDSILGNQCSDCHIDDDGLLPFCIEEA